jgi:hypothetical protein
MQRRHRRATYEPYISVHMGVGICFLEPEDVNLSLL